jgi:hypothetical protein
MVISRSMLKVAEPPSPREEKAPIHLTHFGAVDRGMATRIDAFDHILYGIRPV